MSSQEHIPDLRKPKRTSLEMSTKKESLNVEIKETDSGESTQHSPCPEDAKRDVADNDNAMKRLNHKSSTSSLGEEEKPGLVRGNTFEMDSNEQQKISALRQEYERRQGNLVFRSSIPQYSGHRVDGDSCYLSLDKYDYDAKEKETGKSRLGARSASDENLGGGVTEYEEEYSMSLPVTLNHRMEEGGGRGFGKVWEATPIVSGGATSLDFVVNEVREVIFGSFRVLENRILII